MRTTTRPSFLAGQSVPVLVLNCARQHRRARRRSGAAGGGQCAAGGASRAGVRAAVGRGCGPKGS
eukprot:scaffold129074_cov63-Phaeocystis_antarctica.AAC.2